MRVTPGLPRQGELLKGIRLASRVETYRDESRLVSLLVSFVHASVERDTYCHNSRSKTPVASIAARKEHRTFHILP